MAVRKWNALNVADTGFGLCANPDGSESLCVYAMATHGSKAFSNSAPTTTAALCLAANAGRIKALIINNGTQTVYFGKDNTVTSGNGTPVAAGGNLEDDVSTDAWWAIVASGTGDLRIIEVS